MAGRDRATARLMENFYGVLSAGCSEPEALAIAQRDALRDGADMHIRSTGQGCVVRGGSLQSRHEGVAADDIPAMRHDRGRHTRGNSGAPSSASWSPQLILSMFAGFRAQRASGCSRWQCGAVPSRS